MKKERTYKVLTAPPGSGPFLRTDKYAVTYDGNCEKCPWLESGYCPCVQTFHPGNHGWYDTPEGERIPLLVIKPCNDAPAGCWDESKL